MNIFKKLRDPGSWPGSLASNITANILCTVGIAVLLAFVTFVTGIVEHLGFATSFTLVVVVLAGIVSLVQNIQQWRQSRIIRPSVDKGYRELIRPLVMEAESENLDQDGLHNWIQRTDAALQPQLATHYLDQFREIANRQWDTTDLKRQRLILWLKAYFGLQ